MDEPPSPQPAGATQNLLLDGAIRLWQPARGYRAGMDAALLAGACDAPDGARVLDVGCGAGAALLSAAARRPLTRFVGVERDPKALDLARLNIALNGMAGRVEIKTGDVGQGFAALGLPAFDAAFANPPFFDDPAALRAPAPEKTGAWMAEDGLAAWCDFLLKAVRDGGSVTLIHRADRLDDLLLGLSRRAGSFQIRPVHPFADAPAKRVLVRAIRGGKAPLKLLPALVLHERGGETKHAAQAEAILRGERLAWG